MGAISLKPEIGGCNSFFLLNGMEKCELPGGRPVLTIGPYEGELAGGTTATGVLREGKCFDLWRFAGSGRSRTTTETKGDLAGAINGGPGVSSLTPHSIINTRQDNTSSHLSNEP